jgi:hypothetical protein
MYPNVSDDIKAAVKEVYEADVESIRNLTEVSQKIQTDGLTIPVKLNIPADSVSSYRAEWIGY